MLNDWEDDEIDIQCDDCSSCEFAGECSKYSEESVKKIVENVVIGLMTTILCVLIMVVGVIYNKYALTFLAFFGLLPLSFIHFERSYNSIKKNFRR